MTKPTGKPRGRPPKRTKLRPELSGKPDKVVKAAKKKEFIPVDRAGRRLDDPDRFKKNKGMIQPTPTKIGWWQRVKGWF